MADTDGQQSDIIMGAPIVLHLPAARREEERTKNQIRMHPRARPLNLSTVRFGVPLKLMNLGEIRKTNLKGRVVGKCTRCVMRFESRKRRPALAAPVLQEACSVTGRTHEQLLEDAKGTRGVRGVSYVSPSSKGGEFRQRFKVGQTLGRGAFSTVKLATNRETKAKFAVKIMNTGPGGKASLVIAKRELAILRKLSHEAIMKVEAAFEEGGKMYIVSELLPGGELLQSLVNRGTYTEQDARACFEKLALALAHIHAKGIVHRDIKLENLMLKEPGDVTSVQLIDFGMAKHVDIPELSTSVVGTPIYVAPEVLTAARQAGVNPYGPPVDMWSAGVVLHILLAGYPPFMSDSEPELFNLIRAASFSMDDAVWASVSPEAKALLHGLLEPDTSKRLTAAQVLAHPWFTGTQNAVLSGALANMANTLAQKLRSVMRSAVLAGSAALRRMSSHRRFSTTDTPSSGATTSAHNPLSPRPVLTRAINSVPRFQSRRDDAVESPDVRHNNMKLSLHRRTQSMKQR
eukprot:jgi/Tetstr1/457187/TSEL_043836.t1